ncbi:tryptophan--tRNA ligase [Candidatus Shikimatogenerans bostrichidophilus]|uniref:tryptophan--tRNA ligase n=1 Tax=Candidatus Shikimatogenerans bostrichidophilus TaxID=2943807 RepID=UPI002965D259
MNKKIITGIQSSGIPHIANIYSIILPTLSYIKSKKNYLFFIFIADLHSITNYKNNNTLKNNIYKNAATWLSFLKFTKNVFFYRQSDIKEINELFWYLNCFYPFNRLKLCHVFKSNKNNLNTGIINYPILMASDILLYDINKVIIGKDQKQHIEITRKIAKIINNKLKYNLFIIPKYKIKYNYIIPGIDGNKMSKSKNNIINIFDDKDNLNKQIMSIKTTNKSIKSINYEEIKNTILLKLYKIITNKEEFTSLKEKIKNNKIGFYNIKKKLYKYILYFYEKERKKYYYYINNKNIIKNILYNGYKKVNKIAKKKIFLIKKKLGLII